MSKKTFFLNLLIKYKIFLLSHKVPSISASTNVSVKESNFPLKWQTTDEFFSFERISECDWQENNNNIDVNMAILVFQLKIKH